MARRKISRETPGYLKFSLWALLVGIVVAVVILVKTYRFIFSPIVNVEGDSTILFIPTGSDYEYVEEELQKKGIVKDQKEFQWLAVKKNYPNKVQPGRYRIVDGMSNNELVNMLRAGRQYPVMFMFNHLRTLDELAGVAAEVFEADSSVFAARFKDPEVPVKYGFNVANFPVMFIPNSYEFYWNTTPEEFLTRMKREYVAFWAGKRQDRLKDMTLDEKEVSVLASIVEMESLHEDENATIAGVFMNRLEKGIPLQSDPTIIFAHGNLSIKRVWNKHKSIDSPYNTYRNKGLPPGPICIPSVAAIDAVLNYEDHNYLYFCAKPDFSGYHNFAKNLSQHNKNARSYQNALNRRKIY